MGRREKGGEGREKGREKIYFRCLGNRESIVAKSRATKRWNLFRVLFFFFSSSSLPPRVIRETTDIDYRFCVFLRLDDTFFSICSWRMPVFEWNVGDGSRRSKQYCANPKETLDLWSVAVYKVFSKNSFSSERGGKEGRRISKSSKILEIEIIIILCWWSFVAKFSGLIRAFGSRPKEGRKEGRREKYISARLIERTVRLQCKFRPS